MTVRPTVKQLQALERLVDPAHDEPFDEESSYLMLHNGDALAALHDGDVVSYRLVDRRGRWVEVDERRLERPNLAR